VTVPAGYFDGRTARRHPVILSIRGGVASVEGVDIKRHEPMSSVALGDAIGSAPRIVRFADGGFCEVTDVEGFHRMLAEEGLHRPVVSQWETSWRWVLAAAIVFLAGLFAAYRYAIPSVAEAVAYQVPAAASEMISREVLQFLDRGLLAPSALPSARQDALAAAFGRLRLPDAAGANFRVRFRRGVLLGPNAFALPSGTIVVTDELVLLAQDEREILGVLAHEAGHVDRRHGLRQMLQSSIVGLLVAWYIGDVSTIAAAAPTALIEAKYSRDLEREADAYAAALLTANGIDVRHLIALLRRLDEKARADGAPEGLKYLSSHPATSERLDRLRAIEPPRR
jgi:Zn-dependent protease with chaperone function